MCSAIITNDEKRRNRRFRNECSPSIRGRDFLVMSNNAEKDHCGVALCENNAII